MLKKVSLILCAAAFIFSCSDETTEEPINLKGEIKGQIYMRSEFGATERDFADVKISLQGSTSNVQSTVDVDGKYSFQNLPFGTYNIISEKPGFATTRITGVKLAGGAQPMYQSVTMTRPSTAKLENISLTNSANRITVKGTLMHSDPSAYPITYLVTFLSSSPDVSPEKHSQSASYGFVTVSGSSITLDIMADAVKFPRGSKVYIKFYGFPSGGLYLFNYEKSRYDYIGLSNTPSETFSIVL